MKKLLFSALFASTLLSAQTTLFSEGFTTFSGLAAQGWVSTNQSSPVGTGAWAQGGGTAFSTGGQAGGTTSFTLVNYTSTTGAGTISNWLITPVINVQNGDIFSFYTRKGGTANTFPDRLEFRLSNKGATSAVPSGATGVGDYTTLAVSVNPDLTTGTSSTTGYPITWTQYSYTLSGLAASTDYKAAFRYYVTNGGPSGDNSDIIGVDTYAVTRPGLAVGDVGSAKQGFKLYPTFADKSLTVSFDKDVKISGVSIYDMSGRATGLVKSDVVSANHFVVDVSELKQGTYLINVVTDKGQQSSKFIKK